MENLWIPFLKKIRLKSMKPPRPTQRKFAFKLSYSTTTPKTKKKFSFDLVTVSDYCDIQVIKFKDYTFLKYKL